MMSREEFKNSIKDDVDSYGKPRKLMTKINSLFDIFEAELKAKDEEIAELKSNLQIYQRLHYQS